ncbi:MAG: hypothetical protein ACXQTS_01635 [Candidatus Methanospirareceae archaeon]
MRIDTASNIYGFASVYGDYPFHASIITSFVYRNNFPPHYPQFLHTEMHYPLLMDFYSAILMKSGLDLRSAILIPNVLFQLPLFSLLYFLAYRLTGFSFKGAILAVVIFIFSGFPKADVFESLGFYFLNPIYAVIMPQRSAIFGMAVSFAIYILLFCALFGDEKTKREKNKELILAGTLIGALPYIHAHSFIVTTFVSLFLVSFDFIKNPRRMTYGIKIFCYLFIPIILLSTPQILDIKGQVSKDFFVFFPGWTDHNRNKILGLDWSIPSCFFSFINSSFLFIKFWLLNLGTLSFLIPLGFCVAKKSVKIFYLPFLSLFFIANLLKFQPWWFDNYKIFIHWLALSSIFASLAILWILMKIRGLRIPILAL